MKACSRCKERKPLKDFNWRVKNIKKSSHCKSCSRKYVREHYLKNRNYYLEKARSRNQRIRQKAQEFLSNYLSKHPCVDCGEDDILVLEFDHKDKTGKEGHVASIIKLSNSIEKLRAEVDKCEVRCANCHRRKTEKERKSWRLSYAPVA